jgi:hypothetical protein
LANQKRGGTYTWQIGNYSWNINDVYYNGELIPLDTVVAYEKEMKQIATEKFMSENTFLKVAYTHASIFNLDIMKYLGYDFNSTIDKIDGRSDADYPHEYVGGEERGGMAAILTDMTVWYRLSTGSHRLGISYRTRGYSPDESSKNYTVTLSFEAGKAYELISRDNSGKPTFDLQEIDLVNVPKKLLSP